MTTVSSPPGYFLSKIGIFNETSPMAHGGRLHASNPVATAEILTANALDVVNPPGDPELLGS